MERINYEKRLNTKGGLTIPQGMRRDLSIEGKEKVLLVPQDNGDILVKRVEGVCLFCGSYEGLQAYKGRFVCGSCLKGLGGLADEK